MSSHLFRSLLGAAPIRGSGPHSVTVITKTIDTPADRPVRVKVNLYDQVSGVLVQSQWSEGTNGVATFYGLAAGLYFAVSFDHTGAYNGETVTDIRVPLV